MVGPMVSLRFGAELLARIDEAARAAGVSRAEWVRRASEHQLSSHDRVDNGGNGGR